MANIPEPNFESSVLLPESPLATSRIIFSSKFIWIFALILAISLVASGGIWYWQKTQRVNDVFPVFTPRVIDETADWKTYRNEQYGFTVALADDWQGYSVYEKQWDGWNIDPAKGDNRVVDRGTIIVLRHPEWTEKNHYEDIPIMIFAPSQWSLILQEKMSVSPAPIGPSELGQNSKYFFALPPRYNYDFATGWEEADKIVHTLKAFELGESKWKTYQNNKYHYSIEYPQNWSVDTNNAYDDIGSSSIGSFNSYEGSLAVGGNYASGGTLFLRLDNKPDERGRDNLMFSVVKPDPAITIKEFIPNEASLFNKYDKKESLIINGMSAVRYTDSTCEKEGSVYYCFGTTFIKDIKRGVVYVFTYFHNDLVAPIIATFKLIGPGEGVVCAQVITRAKDPKSGREIDFPTPCDVPEGWVKLESGL